MSKREAEKQITKNDSIFSGNTEQEVVDLAKQASKEVLLKRKIAVPQSLKKRYSEQISTHSSPFANLQEPNGKQLSTSCSTQFPTSTFSFVPPFQQEKKEKTSVESLESLSNPPSLLKNDIKNEYDLFLHRRSVNYFFQKAIDASITEDPFGDLSIACQEYIDYRKQIDKSTELSDYIQSDTKKDTAVSKEQTNKSSDDSFISPKGAFDCKNKENKNSLFSFLKKPEEKMDENIQVKMHTVDSNKLPSSTFGIHMKNDDENIQSAFGSPAAKNKSISETNFAIENTNNLSKTSQEKQENQSNTKHSLNSETKTVSTSFITNTPNTPTFSFPVVSQTNDSATNKKITSISENLSVPKISKLEKSTFSFEVKKPDIEMSNKSSNETHNKNLFSFTPITKTETNTPNNANSTPIFNFGLSVPSKDISSDFSWTPNKGIKFATSPSNNNDNNDNNNNNNNTADKTPKFQFLNPLSTGKFVNENISQHKPNESVGFEFGSKTNPGFSFGQISTFNPTFTNFEQKNVSTTETAEDDVFPQEPRTNDDLIAAKGEGEENEDTIFTTKAKIYKYFVKENRFSDLGIGILKLNIDKDTSKARVLARLEGSGKVIINIGLQKDFQYLITGKKSVKIPAVSSEGTGIDTYLVRVRDEEISKELTDLLESKKLGKQ
ncbi:hypothetical protein PNEG_00802 [Pneumocystis murina B123]|uniref:RanBD1 domain-containing protein n=1 Tax=Pneumocystis murina (strain B123) TaxID=1069680 RepID=M7NV96_PNEMU|nr:hypothetical protein PNEG_00802 [Pneumocystis murina B123]EMR11212.1 hypothetical protein PNEG_00802 [Pneumocystis murina B123]